MGLKSVALYRDGSKRTQPLSLDLKSKKSEGFFPIRRRLPDERKALTHKFNVAGLEGYLTVGLFEDGSPGEIFMVVAKEGSTLSGVMDAFATSISIALQYGVPLSTLVRKFTYMRFEPAGFTQNKDIPSAQSIVDYVFRWLAIKFLSAEECRALGLKVINNGEKNDAEKNGESKVAQAKVTVNPPADAAKVVKQNGSASHGSNGHKDAHHKDGHKDGHKEGQEIAFQNLEDAPPCTNCGSALMVRQAGCYCCLNCGSQGGCG
jgi:ribonucleoside-diphosphate reductase alpha chain